MQVSLVVMASVCLLGGFKCILVWSLGEKDTIAMCKKLRTYVRSNILIDESNIQIIPLTAQSSNHMIETICRKDVPQGWQRVVIATAKAQVGHTIRGCDVSIDSGLSRIFILNKKTNLPELVDIPLTKWDLLQRIGRVSRDNERGITFLLQPKDFRDDHRFVKEVVDPGVRTEFLGRWIMKNLEKGRNPYTVPYPWKRGHNHTKYCAWLLHSLGVVNENHFKSGMTSKWETDGNLLTIMMRLPLQPKNALMFINAISIGPSVAKDVAICVAMLELNPFMDPFYRLWSVDDHVFGEEIKEETEAEQGAKSYQKLTKFGPKVYNQ